MSLGLSPARDHSESSFTWLKATRHRVEYTKNFPLTSYFAQQNDCMKDTNSTKYLNIAAIIVQYNTWKDTINCIESILSCDDQPRWIIIVDNNSTNNAAQNIFYWAHGRVNVPSCPVINYATPDFPLQIQEISWVKGCFHATPQTQLILVHMPHNGGYASGNNAGLKLGLDWGAEAFLILNNDTIVTKKAIGALYSRLTECARPGLCGALLRYCHDALPIQCCAGGVTNWWTHLSSFTGNGLTLEQARNLPRELVEGNINFICGACVMVSRKFVETVGFMDEGYFLYCEEQDWACRSKKEFDLAYAPEALVYHREGATTGWNGNTFRIKSLLLLTRSRIRCTYLHHPWMLPTVIAGIGFATTRLLLKKLVAKVLK